MDDNARSLKSRYEALVPDRQTFLDRARQCSELTLPTLIPPEGHSGSTIYPTPWQSVGARGVNALASKLLMTLLPPNHPFFRLRLDDMAIMKLAGDLTSRARIESGLAKYERAVMAEIETNGFRAPIFAGLKHLIVAGNVTLHVPAKGQPRVFPLDSYVALRDGAGNLLDHITRECLSKDALDDAVLALLDDEHDEDEEAETARDPREEVEVFTRYYRDGKVYREYQEVCGKRVPGSEAVYPVDKPGKLVLRWTADPGADYGRGYVEEFLGDLMSLDTLRQAMTESGLALAKLLFLVAPNGTTRPKDLSEAENCAFVAGMASEVTPLQANKHADMSVPAALAKQIQDDLSFAFMLSSAVQRKGERVTAEEIRYMANELESTLGGTFSTLASEFQMPLVRRVITRMNKAKSLPPLPDGIKDPVILTGLDALGRSAELDKYRSMLAMLQPFPDLMKRVNEGNLIDRLATAHMIDTEGLFYTDEELQAQQAEAMQQQQAMAGQQQMGDIAGRAAPAAIKAISDHMQQQAGPPPGAPPA